MVWEAPSAAQMHNTTCLESVNAQVGRAGDDMELAVRL